MTFTGPAAMQAEIARLTAENEKLTKLADDLRASLTAGETLPIEETPLGRDRTIARLRAALKPFAEPHAMGDNYVKFAPRLIAAARDALEQSTTPQAFIDAKKERDDGWPS